MKKTHGHAVVLGGSMAGLLAARVLTDHFDKVTLVERDPLDTSTDPRKGVPQGRHVHALLSRCEQITEQLFPGIVDSLVADGAVRIDFGNDIRWYHYGAWKPLVKSEVMTVCASRPFLEAHVRARLLALPVLRPMGGCDVKGLRAGPGGRISGVQIQHRDTGAEESIDADLVVDATGRGSSLPRWLSALGCGETQEEIVKVHVGYASRVYRLPEGRAGETLGMFIVGRPPGDKRLGVIAPIEGGRAICTLGGLVRDYPPEDPAGYLEFARSLAVDDLYRVLSAAEPLSDVISYRFGSQQRRRYERTEHFPDGIVALGDSVCSFNPIYGQGMTTAALSALALDEALRKQKTSGPSLTGFSRRFQAALARIHDGPWLMACGEDFRYPEVEGQRPPGYPALRWYTSRVHEAATRDPVVTVEFLKVMHMLEPITALMQPRMLRHVLWASLPA